MDGGTTRALLIGASGGIGAALVAALGARGAEVTKLSRRDDGIDVTCEASVAAALARLDHPFDLVFVATGALASTRARPEKALAEFGAEEALAQFRLNAVAPALVLKHLAPRMARKGRTVFAVLSARVGSVGDNRLGGWYSYRTSKAALNALIHGAAVELRRTRPGAVLVCLHPGTVETRFTSGFPDHDKVTPAVAAARLCDVVAGLGPESSGGFYDHAGREIGW